MFCLISYYKSFVLFCNKWAVWHCLEFRKTGRTFCLHKSHNGRTVHHWKEDEHILQKKDKDRRKGNGRRFYLGVEEFIKFLAALQLFCTRRFALQDELHQDDLKDKDEFILFFKIVLGKTASATRN